MKLIVCIDAHRGMAFNHRRQSRDRLLIDDMLGYIGANTLYISPYSIPLFTEQRDNIRVDAALLTVAEEQDYCFLEDIDPSGSEESVEEIVLYHWNRHYPADVYFTLDMSSFMLTDSYEFVGSSHEKITREIWKK